MRPASARLANAVLDSLRIPEGMNMHGQGRTIRKFAGLRACFITVSTVIGLAHHAGADAVWFVHEVRRAAEYRPVDVAQGSDENVATEVFGILSKDRRGSGAQAGEIVELKECVARNPPSHGVAVAELLIGHALSESRDETERGESKQWLQRVIDGYPDTREARLAEVDLSLLKMVAAVGAPLGPPSDALRAAWAGARDATKGALSDYGALDSATDPLSLAVRRRLGGSEREPLAAAAKMRIAQFTIGIEGFRPAKGILHELMAEYPGTAAADWAGTVLKGYGESEPGPAPGEGQRK